MGYGGNYNSTTRFRRYDGNEAGITDPKVRPAILKEDVYKRQIHHFGVRIITMTLLVN